MAEVGCKGRLTLSINPFIPKPLHRSNGWPWTIKNGREKLQYIKKALQRIVASRLLVESPKEAYIQGVLARGDRRLGAILAACAADRGSKSFKAEMKAAGLDMDEMNYRERSFDEFLPWESPRHGDGRWIS